MALNWVRGFRRIGWVVILLVGTFFASITYDDSDEFVGYDTAKIQGKYPYWDAEFVISILEAEKTNRDFTVSEATAFFVGRDVKKTPGESGKIIYEVHLPNRAITIESEEISVNRLRASLQTYLEENEQELGLLASDNETRQEFVKAKLRDFRLNQEFPYSPEVVTTRLNIWAFLWKSVVGFAVLTVFVQGTISVLAWILRGFASLQV